MPKTHITAIVFMQPHLGRTRLPVQSTDVHYKQDGKSKRVNLLEFVKAFIDTDPVLELEDGNLVRICQAGDPSYIRSEAQALLDSYSFY